MLEVNIYKQLPHFDVEMDFCCPAGELLAMVGPSGAGKTTIMRILAGLERPDRGRITLNGRTWVDTEKRIFLQPQKRQLGYVFQEFTLFPHLSVAKNVAFAAPEGAQVGMLLELFGIQHLADQKPPTLSGGERQRVALAQALARNPQILLLDEPFSALDVVTKEALRALLTEIKKQRGLPIIHITHDLQEASLLADRLLAVERGKEASGWLDGFASGKVTVLEHCNNNDAKQDCKRDVVSHLLKQNHRTANGYS